MIIYALFEGKDKNDNDMVTDFYKLDRAIAAFKASKYPYALLNKYEGNRADQRESYLDTLMEKGGSL